MDADENPFASKLKEVEERKTGSTLNEGQMIGRDNNIVLRYSSGCNTSGCFAK